MTGLPKAAWCAGAPLIDVTFLPHMQPELLDIGYDYRRFFLVTTWVWTSDILYN